MIINSLSFSQSRCVWLVSYIIHALTRLTQRFENNEAAQLKNNAGKILVLNCIIYVLSMDGKE